MKIEVRNPANPREIVARHTATNLEDLNALVQRVRDARKLWAQVPQPERGRLVGLFLSATEDNAEEIARSMTLEMGKTLGESRGEIANDVAFSLTSCLCSEQGPMIERFLAETESGMLHINAGSFPKNHLPFVGVKGSALGVGGANGASTIQFCPSEHSVYRKGAA